MNKKLNLYDVCDEITFDVTQKTIKETFEMIDEGAFSLSSATYVLLHKLYDITIEQDKQIRYLIETCKGLQNQINMIDDPDNVNGSW